jgi:uncharacterized protein (TIRG00374 family)
VKKTAALIAKLGVTLVLLYFALSRANLELVAQRAEQLDAAWLLAAVAVLSLQTVISALRWRSILGSCGAAISTLQASRYTFIALFFSQVLPSTIGGDAVRVWLVARDGVGWAKATYAAILDRVVGVLALALLVVFGIPASFAMIHDPLARTALLMLGLASALAPMLFIAMGVRQWTILTRFSATRHLNIAAQAGHRILTSRRDAIRIMGLSFVIQFLTIAGAWLAAKSVAAPFSFIDATVMVPPVLLIATIPISIAGWGLREGAMVMAFSYSGLPQADGLLVSALFGIAMFAVGALGGLLWLAGKRRKIESALHTGA